MRITLLSTSTFAHSGKSESGTRPYPTSSAPPPAASPVSPPTPFPACAHYSIAVGANTDSSQELLQSAFLRLSWLLQPVSWLCSLWLCVGQYPFLPPPRPSLGTTPGPGPRGGRAPWAQVGGPSKVGRYSGVLPLHWRCLGCKDSGWGTPVSGSEAGHSAPPWQGLGQSKGAPWTEARSLSRVADQKNLKENLLRRCAWGACR